MTLSPERFGKVAVLFGGDSSERAVSLKSGQSVLDGLLRSGVDAHAVDPSVEGLTRLEQGGFDRAFIVLHGRGGEDGVIQGALEAIGLPYTGSGVLGSALGMDKFRCKLIWQALGFSTPGYVLVRGASDLARAEALGFPLMVKPAHEGSSIGMAKVEDASQLQMAWETAAGFDSDVLIEQWIDGQEFTASLLGNEALPLICLETPHTFYDYAAKYTETSTRYHCPCGLPEAKEQALQAFAVQAFQAVGASGWGRVDLMLDTAGTPYLLEVNTVPGMTDHSLVPLAAKVLGIGFDDLVVRILSATLESV